MCFYSGVIWTPKTHFLQNSGVPFTVSDNNHLTQWMEHQIFCKKSVVGSLQPQIQIVYVNAFVRVAQGLISVWRWAIRRRTSNQKIDVLLQCSSNYWILHSFLTKCRLPNQGIDKCSSLYNLTCSIGQTISFIKGGGVQKITLTTNKL